MYKDHPEYIQRHKKSKERKRSRSEKSRSKERSKQKKDKYKKHKSKRSKSRSQDRHKKSKKSRRKSESEEKLDDKKMLEMTSAERRAMIASWNDEEDDKEQNTMQLENSHHDINMLQQENPPHFMQDSYKKAEGITENDAEEFRSPM